MGTTFPGLYFPGWGIDPLPFGRGDLSLSLLSWGFLHSLGKWRQEFPKPMECAGCCRWPPTGGPEDYMVAACTRMRGWSLQCTPLNHSTDWPVLIHLGKVTVIKTAVLKVLWGNMTSMTTGMKKLSRNCRLLLSFCSPTTTSSCSMLTLLLLKQPPRRPTPAPVSSPSSSLPTATPFPKSPTYRGYWKALATWGALASRIITVLWGCLGGRLVAVWGVAWRPLHLIECHGKHVTTCWDPTSFPHICMAEVCVCMCVCLSMCVWMCMCVCVVCPSIHPRVAWASMDLKCDFFSPVNLAVPGKGFWFQGQNSVEDW